jgi:hypothetical protein
LSPDSIATTAPSDSLSAARHFPGAPVIDKPAPDPRRTRAEEGLSSSRDTLLPVPRPLRRRVPRRPLQVPKRLPWPSPNPHRLGTLSSPPKREPSRRCRLRYTLRTEQLLHPASTPASRPDPGASLPGTLASPRTGLTPAGCRELDARLRHDHSFHITRPGCWTHVDPGLVSGLSAACRGACTGGRRRSALTHVWGVCWATFASRLCR